MFRLMRNVHLWLGLASVLMALMFALSSLFVVFRQSFDSKPQESQRTVQVSPELASTPRALARELILNHGLKGELAAVNEDAEGMTFRIHRPGTEHSIDYSKATGAVTISDKQWALGQTLLQVHVMHGFWHEWVPGWIWALLGFLTSVALLLLGASGIYLWFAHHKERVIGGVLLAVGLIYGISTLVLTRMDS